MLRFDRFVLIDVHQTAFILLGDRDDVVLIEDVQTSRGDVVECLMCGFGNVLIRVIVFLDGSLMREEDALVRMKVMKVNEDVFYSEG
ncbi:hypothetical protein Tco_0017593 [Tanacetum coccineum]